MDIFDFEELMVEILNISDERREDEDFIFQRFYNTYGADFEDGYKLAKALLEHTVPIEAGFSKKDWHAFVSKRRPVMLMKIEAD